MSEKNLGMKGVGFPNEEPTLKLANFVDRGILKSDEDYQAVCIDGFVCVYIYIYMYVLKGFFV